MGNYAFGSEEYVLSSSLNELDFNILLEYISKYCISESGKELILNLSPSNNFLQLQRELDLIEEIILCMTEDENIPLEGLPEVRPLFQKALITNASLSTSELLRVRNVMKVSRLLRHFFIQRKEKYANIFELAELLSENRIIEKHISDAIDENGEIKDTASRELARIRQEIISTSNRLRSRLQKILSKVSEEDMVMEEFITVREGRFVLPIKAEHKRHIPGIIHNVSQTGSTVFLEPSETFEMNNELSLLLSDEKREIQKILTNLTAEIGQCAREFLRSIEIIAHLDAVIAKAKYALEYGGIKPTLTESTEIILNNIRHPLLVHAKGIKNVQALSIDFSGEKRGHLISGPNAGGKTVALKSIGINIAMALSGIFPLGECTTNYRNIFSSIGDHQSIENDLSTFSSQIIRLKDILNYCDADSLVLIDEICSGTDPQEGSALASGIIDSFLNIKLFFIVTTHQSSLKTYALSKPEIANASLEFDEKNLKPTYRFLPGIPGNSYAFVLAENLGISPLVLERAKNYLGDRHSEIEKSISILQIYKAEAETTKKEAAQERLKFQNLKKKFEEKYDELKIKKKKILDEASQEAYTIIDNANVLIEKTIREIKEEKKAISNIKSEFNEEKSKIESKISTSSPVNQNTGTKHFEEGDFVFLSESPNNLGTVLESDNAAKTALVEFNGFKFRLPFAQLNLSSKKPKEKKDIPDYIKFDAETRIDLRGLRADEAIRQVDSFLDEAVLGNVPCVTIIHGKGTGALRVAIQDYLHHHPNVKSYRNGTLVEGGDGVTIVDFQ